MYKLVVIGTVMASALGMTHPVNPDLVNDIKNKADSWKPAEPETNPLKNLNIAEIKGLLGTIVQGPVGLPSPAVPNGDAPKEFDSRTKWSNCIHPIRDQARCGSCWAFGASEVLSDRICIASNGSTDVVISP